MMTVYLKSLLDLCLVQQGNHDSRILEVGTPNRLFIKSLAVRLDNIL